VGQSRVEQIPRRDYGVQKCVGHRFLAATRREMIYHGNLPSRLHAIPPRQKVSTQNLQLATILSAQGV
jgi:hypothetical protein